MLSVAKMRNVYHLAGSADKRAHLARRLDRLALVHLCDALENLATQDLHSGENGPVICIRKLRLSLWLNTAELEELHIARDWAQTLMRALYRQIADGGADEVMHFPSEAAYLATWANEYASGLAKQRWYFSDLSWADDLPAGRAISTVLSRSPEQLSDVFKLLVTQKRLAGILSSLTEADVTLLWNTWTSIDPSAIKRLPDKLLERVCALTIAPQKIEPHNAAGRARTALRFLIALTTAPSGLKPEVAASVAMQLSYVATLAVVYPNFLRTLNQANANPASIITLLNDVSSELHPARDWVRAQLDNPSGLATIRSLLALVQTDPSASIEQTLQSVITPTKGASQLESRQSAYAGVVLLLPAIDALGIAQRLGPAGLQTLLAASIGQQDGSVAEFDPGLRWLSGLADTPTPNPSEPGWLTMDELDLSPADIERDAQTHGPSTVLPTLFFVANHFTQGLRAMNGSSLSYLARQFFFQPGTITRSSDALVVSLNSIPMGILLRMGSRLGDQGSPPWLGGRRLIVEIRDAR